MLYGLAQSVPKLFGFIGVSSGISGTSVVPSGYQEGRDALGKAREGADRERALATGMGWAFRASRLVWRHPLRTVES